jgi:alkanesulfonate monooxygenase SsuD/methylene tetrahydromethanopterin reductase-like flavin-dependent oxidoreductase (luciferase family)
VSGTVNRERGGSVKLGMQIQGEAVSMQEIVAYGKAVEAAGFDTVWLSEAWRDSLVCLTAIAAITTTVGLGSNITQWTRSLPNLDLASGDLQELSNGRFKLGLGPMPKDWNEEWHGIAYEKPVRRMREYVTALRAMRAASFANPVSFHGEVFNVTNYVRLNGPCVAPPPTLLAVTRHGMANLAGEIADGVNYNTMVSNDYARDILRPIVEEGAVSAGRARAAGHQLACPITAVADTTEEALRRARHQLGFYAGMVPYFDDVARFAGHYDAVMAAKAAFPTDPFAAVALLPDDLVEKLTIFGTPDEVRDKVKRYEGWADEISLVTPSFLLDPGAISEGYDAIIDAFRR